jgi:hypothetical protein
MASQRPLSPPDPQTSSKIALKGAIGLALEMALEDVQNEIRGCAAQQDEDQPCDGVESHRVPITTLTTAPATTMLHCVQECFGTSVSGTDWSIAPNAVLKGRLDHYNRFQGQWRIVVDRHAEIGPRPKGNNMGNNKRKREESTMSLLEEVDNTIKLDDKVQILVYNDL